MSGLVSVEGHTLLYGPPVARARTFADESPLVFSPCWASVEEEFGGVEIIVAGESCFLDMNVVARSVQEVSRRPGTRFECLKRICAEIERAEKLMNRRDIFLFSFDPIDLDRTERYLDHERFAGLYMTWSGQLHDSLRRVIVDPSRQADPRQLIEIRESLEN